MKQIIINADDFGFSSGINKGIIKSYKKGLTTSTSIVCNTKNFDRDIKELKKLEELGKGVHLNLTVGKPISNERDIPTLTNKKGLFEKNVYNFIFKLTILRVKREHIERELEAQIKKAVYKLDDIDHIDSHQHVHILPQIYPIVLKLAKKYKIPFVRIPKQNFWINPTNRLIEKISLSSLSLLNNIYNSNRYKKRIKNFYGLYYGGLNTSLLNDVINHFKEGNGEIVCHPAYPDSFIDNNWNSLKKDRLNDLNTLINPISKRIIKNNGVKLIRFTDLT